MKKSEWLKLYNILNGFHSEFLLGLNGYRHGKNKKIRESGERKLDHAMQMSKLHLERNPYAYELIFGKEGQSPFGKVIAVDEFFSFNYYGNDMAELLRKIKEIIDTLE